MYMLIFILHASIHNKNVLFIMFFITIAILSGHNTTLFGASKSEIQFAENVTRGKLHIVHNHMQTKKTLEQWNYTSSNNTAVYRMCL